jgi:hypothetical protein
MSMAKQRTMLEDARLQIALLPRPIQNWMLWMNLVFLAGLLFVDTHEAVRWVIAAYVVSFPVAVPIYIYTRDIAMTGVPHILFWTPLLIYLSVEAAEDTNFSLLSLYGVWTVLLFFTIAISVVFDVRAVLKHFSRRSQD